MQGGLTRMRVFRHAVSSNAEPAMQLFEHYVPGGGASLGASVLASKLGRRQPPNCGVLQGS
eukprot:2076776-Amphidinium_carterae.1